jgi:hypothetical protein
MTEFSMDDLIFYNEDGQINSGGYSVNSALLKQNMSPMVTINQEQQGGKNVSSPFENLAVPVGIYYLTQKFPKHEDGIHLAWSTAAEINNEKFEVERSIDGEHFEYAGTIKGKGNSVKISNYRFIDPINSNNEWFYRIKQIDFDGKFEYSRTIKSLALQQKEPRIFTVMATQEIAVEAQEAIKSLEIINSQGQVIATLTNNGNNRFQLPYALNGIYIISVQTANQYYTQKMFLGSN